MRTAWQGYTLVGGDGSVYNFGTEFHSDLRGKALNAPVIGIANTLSGKGYRLATTVGSSASATPASSARRAT